MVLYTRRGEKCNSNKRKGQNFVTVVGLVPHLCTSIAALKASAHQPDLRQLVETTINYWFLFYSEIVPLEHVEDAWE